MCLAVPGRVVSIGADELRTATVSFGGVTKQVSLVLVPEAVAGDYVIVHVGFAISRLDEAAAQRTLEELSALSRQQVRRPGSPSVTPADAGGQSEVLDSGSRLETCRDKFRRNDEVGD